jgi:hypothetical protein
MSGSGAEQGKLDRRLRVDLSGSVALPRTPGIGADRPLL